jgi:hypothetical protein
MKLNFIIFILLIVPFSAVHAQHSEIGLFFGTSYYLGELNQTGQAANQPNLSLGLFYRKNLSDRYSYRIGVNYGKLSARDNFYSTGLSEWRQLSFSSTIFEGNALFEFNFLPYQINNRSTSWFSPYVFIGLAVFGVTPEVESGNTNKISKLETTIAPSVPFGMGIKFNFLKNMGIAVEWSMHKTFTDEIDGLPPSFVGGYQLSNSKNNDWYSFLGITLNYKFLTQNDRCPGANN